ncbi:MAG: hypothetical protein K2J80_10525 [Oscillospiraceae bacterium]|nr:hypothetical protein [Oscillospiraceae bacterium]
MDITDEMANREARRCDTLRILNHQTNCFEALDDISVIQRELDRYVNECKPVWA